ncbi:hypothetical protein ABMZ06_26660 [Pseudomonas aeruginosa]
MDKFGATRPRAPAPGGGGGGAPPPPAWLARFLEVLGTRISH